MMLFRMLSQVGPRDMYYMGIGDVDAATGRGTFAGSDMFREISAKSSTFAKKIRRKILHFPAKYVVP